MPVPIPFRRQYAEITRARQITEILIKNGLGFVVEQSGLSRFLSFWRRRRVEGATLDVDGLSVSERVRCTLEELGPTFIKIGQVLSGRADLLPAEYIRELTKLLDAAPPVPKLQIEACIEEELGAPLNELFATFESEPPDWDTWDASHLSGCRLVAREGKGVVGWAALSPCRIAACTQGQQRSASTSELHSSGPKAASVPSERGGRYPAALPDCTGARKAPETAGRGGKA